MEVPLTPGKTAFLINFITDALALITLYGLVRTLNALGRWRLYHSGKVDINMHFHDMGFVSALFHAFHVRRVSCTACALLWFQAVVCVIILTLKISVPVGLSESKNYRVDRNHTVPGDSLCRMKGRAYATNYLGEAAERIKKHFQSGGITLRVGRTGRNADALILEDEAFSLGRTLALEEFRIPVPMNISDGYDREHIEFDDDYFYGEAFRSLSMQHTIVVFAVDKYSSENDNQVVEGPMYMMFTVDSNNMPPYDLELYEFAICDLPRVETTGKEFKIVSVMCSIANLKREITLDAEWRAAQPATQPLKVMEKSYPGLNLSELGIRSIMVQRSIRVIVHPWDSAHPLQCTEIGMARKQTRVNLYTCHIHCGMKLLKLLSKPSVKNRNSSFHNMSPIQKKRTQLKQSTKLQITNELSTGTTVDGIVRKYNVSRRTVYNIKKRAHSIQSLDEQSRTLNCFRQRPAKYPEIEQRLLHFLSAARAMKMPVTASVIQVKARQIHHHLMQSNNETLCAAIQDFKASNGWVQKFVIRHNLRSVSLHGQAGSVDVLKVAGDISTLRQQLSAFDPNNIFNVDETGVFYRLLPRRTYILQNENRKTVRGTKNMKAKDRITGFICTNATGTLKLPVAVIGSSKEPRCFRKQTPPLPYFSQKNAWSDEPTFRKWFYTVFLPIVRKHTNSDVALIMDNCSAHGDLKDNRDQVTIFNLPPNCTALFQPMDCGVIAALKVRYRHLLLNEIIWSFEDRDQRRELAKNMTAGTKGLAEGHEPHLLDAMELVVKAWEAVSKRTVIRCWIKSELLPQTVRSDMEAVYGKQNLLQSREQECLEEDLCTAFKTLRICASKEGQTDTLLDNVCNEDVIRWVNIEDNPDVQGAMLEDVCEDLVNEALLENSNDNEEEKERLTHSTIDAVAVVKPVPSSGVISKMFASLERLATDCELDRFGHLLRVAKREVLNISTRRAMERQRQTKLSEFWQ